MRTKEPAIIQLVSILQELSIIRAGDLSKYGIHPEVLKRAVHHGLVVKIGRGIYTRKDLGHRYRTSDSAGDETGPARRCVPRVRIDVPWTLAYANAYATALRSNIFSFLSARYVPRNS